MFIIDKNNYEEYILDYLEGNLSPQAELAMLKFLAENPLVEQEIEDLHDYQLQEEKLIVFPHKEKLKKKPKFTRRTVMGIAASLLVFITMAIVFTYTLQTGVDVESSVVEAVIEAEAEVESEAEAEVESEVVREGVVEAEVEVEVEAEVEVEVEVESVAEVDIAEEEEFGNDSAFAEAEVKQKREAEDIINENGSSGIEIVEKLTANNDFKAVIVDVPELKSKGVRVYEKGRFSFFGEVEEKLDSINENINPYLEFAQANGLISESYEIKPLSLKTLAEAFIPESF